MPRKPSPVSAFPTLTRWFLVFGVVGLVVALIMLYALSHEVVEANLALIFWPASMVLLSESDTLWVKILTTALAFGGNFLLYGFVGLIVGAIANRFKRTA
jgi:hypothetical protein